MNPSLKVFGIRIIVLTLAVLILGYVLFFTVFKEYYFPLFPFIPFFFFILSLAVYTYLIKISRKDDRQFITHFLAATGIKLLVYILIVVIILFADKKHAFAFLLTFLVMYFLYTSFDVFAILKYLKNRQ